MSMDINFSGLGRAIGLAAAAAVGQSFAKARSSTGCSYGQTGVPLAEFDTGGVVPTGVALLGSSKIVITPAEALSIRLEGGDEAQTAVRFAMDGNTLSIARANASRDAGEVMVHIAMPAPETLMVGGSGRVECGNIASEASVAIVGSGSVHLQDIEARKLKVEILGSGNLEASGAVRKLKLVVAGSGVADMADLTAEKAKVTMPGSGRGAFRCNGKVKAAIIGSGVVRVIGRASCEVQTFGSGRLICEDVATATAHATG